MQVQSRQLLALDPVQGEENMLLGVVSDTHGHVPFTRQAVRMLETMAVEEVLHCGDIGSPEVIELFRPWPTHYVFGNVDYDLTALEEAILRAEHSSHGQFGTLALEGKRVAWLHGHDERRLAETIQSGDYDLVCHGHTHIAEHHLRGDTWVLNPGAIYRANPRSIAVVELPELVIHSLPLG